MFDCTTVKGMLLNNIQINNQGFLSLYSHKNLDAADDQDEEIDDDTFEVKKYVIDGPTIFPAL